MAPPPFAADGTMNAQGPPPALPSFLGEDPFLNPRADGRPNPAGSGATDVTSDVVGSRERVGGNDIVDAIPSTTGPVGDIGLPPSRPTSIASASTARGNRLSMQQPSARKAMAAMAAGRQHKGSVDAEGNESRPTSSMSKTHVPSLTPQSFYRPMSSQMLQAQRNQRPGSGLAQHFVAVDDSSRPGTAERPGQAHRYSTASVNTLPNAQSPTQEDAPPPPPSSRGSGLSQARDTTKTSNTAASATTGASAAPLQGRLAPIVTKLNSSTLGVGTSATSDRTPRSPKSLRASLGLSSRASKQDADRRPTGQHEKLASYPSSPTNAEKRLRNGRSSNKSTGKNYEYYAGNMLFFLSGRLLNTKARPLNVVTFILTVLPCALFFGFSASFLWYHVSPAIPIIFAYFFYIALSSFLHAALSDPGILPRNLHPHPPNPEEERDPLTVGPATTEWVMVKTFPSARRAPLPGRANSHTPENGTGTGVTTAMEVPTKYCKSCNIWRPPRAHHCRVCDGCIETQDHHCVWLNNCVGRRNYRYFFAYVGFASILCLLLLAFSIVHISSYAAQHGISFANSLSGRPQERVAFAMFFYSILALPYPGSLFLYHLFLVARGETTREYLNSHKFMPKDRHRPFSQSSWLRNWISVLFRPRPPSYLQFKHPYVEGDLRLGHTQRKKDRRGDLRKRFSVQRPAVEANGVKPGVEMKQMTPRPGQMAQQKPPPPGLVGGLVTGPANSTPR